MNRVSTTETGKLQNIQNDDFEHLLYEFYLIIFLLVYPVVL